MQPVPYPPAVMARFWIKVQVEDGCWLWTGHCNPEGYGQVTIDCQPRGAHRVAYEMLVGPIPEGLCLDHLCRVRNCVKPEHLEPVTQQENILRGVGVTAEKAQLEFCPRGHAYSGDNLFFQKNGGRKCRACHRENTANYRKRKAQGMS